MVYKPRKPIDRVAEGVVSRDVNILRHSEDINASIQGELKVMEMSIVSQMRGWGDAGSANMSRLSKLLGKSYKEVDKAFRAAGGHLTKSVRDIIRLEAKGIIQTINRGAGFKIASAKKLTRSSLEKIAGKSLIEGAPSSEWWSRQSQGLKGRFKDQMRSGILNGESVEDMVRRVRGRSTGKVLTTKVNGKIRKFHEFSGGVMDTTTKNARGLVRSSLNSAANESRMEAYKANSDVLRGVQALVTLDNRTSSICMSRSGAAWDLEDHKPLPDAPVKIPWPGPPAWHWQCRSTLIPVFKDAKDLGIPEDIFGDDKAQQATMFGPVMDKPLTYEGWFQRQGAAFQKSVLGLKKFKIWKKQGLPFREMFDPVVGRALTIKELEPRTLSMLQGKIARVRPTLSPRGRYREMTTRAEAEASFEGTTRKLQADLTPDQMEALKRYEGMYEHIDYEDLSVDLNNQLRLGEKPFRTAQKVIDEATKQLDDAFAVAPGSARNVKLYRGVGDHMSHVEAKKLVGTVIEDKGFQSLSAMRGVAEDYATFSSSTNTVIYEILTPKGTKMIPLQWVTKSQMFDAEVLLGRGTKFRVLKVVKQHGAEYGGFEAQTRIIMQVVEPEKLMKRIARPKKLKRVVDRFYDGVRKRGHNPDRALRFEAFREKYGQKFKGMHPEQRDNFLSDLADSYLPENALDGIKEIKLASLRGGGRNVAAIYDIQSKTIVLGSKGTNVATLLHEIGHHIDLHSLKVMAKNLPKGTVSEFRKAVKSAWKRASKASAKSTLYNLERVSRLTTDQKELLAKFRKMKIKKLPTGPLDDITFWREYMPPPGFDAGYAMYNETEFLAEAWRQYTTNPIAFAKAQPVLAASMDTIYGAKKAVGAVKAVKKTAAVTKVAAPTSRAAKRAARKAAKEAAEGTVEETAKAKRAARRAKRKATKEAEGKAKPLTRTQKRAARKAAKEAEEAAAVTKGMTSAEKRAARKAAREEAAKREARLAKRAARRAKKRAAAKKGKKLHMRLDDEFEEALAQRGHHPDRAARIKDLEKRLEGKFEGISVTQQKVFIDAFADSNYPTAFANGLRKITVKKRITDRTVAGVYYVSDGTIEVAAGTSRMTFIHELGHHIDMTLAPSFLRLTKGAYVNYVGNMDLAYAAVRKTAKVKVLQALKKLEKSGYKLSPEKKWLQTYIKKNDSLPIVQFDKNWRGYPQPDGYISSYALANKREFAAESWRMYAMDAEAFGEAQPALKKLFDEFAVAQGGTLQLKAVAKVTKKVGAAGVEAAKAEALRVKRAAQRAKKQAEGAAAKKAAEAKREAAKIRRAERRATRKAKKAAEEAAARKAAEEAAAAKKVTKEPVVVKEPVAVTAHKSAARKDPFDHDHSYYEKADHRGPNQNKAARVESLTKKLEKRMKRWTVADKEILIDVLADSPFPERFLVGLKRITQKKSIDGRGLYYAFAGRIELSNASVRTLIHELGHHIDHEIVRALVQVRKLPKGFTDKYSKAVSAQFVKARRKAAVDTRRALESMQGMNPSSLTQHQHDLLSYIKKNKDLPPVPVFKVDPHWGMYRKPSGFQSSYALANQREFMAEAWMEYSADSKAFGRWQPELKEMFDEIVVAAQTFKETKALKAALGITKKVVAPTIPTSEAAAIREAKRIKRAARRAARKADQSAEAIAKREAALKRRAARRAKKKAEREALKKEAPLAYPNKRNFDVTKKSKGKLLRDIDDGEELFSSVADIPKNNEATAKALGRLMKSDPGFSSRDIKAFVDILEKEQNALFNSFKATGYSDEELVASVFMKQWAVGSGELSPISILLQKAVQQEFGLSSATFWFDASSDFVKAGLKLWDNPAVQRVTRSVARSIYSHTQKVLKAQGIKELTLWRGVRGMDVKQKIVNKVPIVSEKTVKLQPMSSFTTDVNTAIEFGSDYHGVLIQTTVPVKDVFCTGFTGVGTVSESEIIVLGQASGQAGVPVRVLRFTDDVFDLAEEMSSLGDHIMGEWQDTILELFTDEADFLWDWAS